MRSESIVFISLASTKIIPYIRIGICVIHPEFQKIYQQLVAQSYYFSYQHPSLISQATLESYLRSQLYHKQVESITQHFKPYYAMLKKVSASWDPHLARMTGDFNCYYVSVLLHPGISISRLEKRTAAAPYPDCPAMSGAFMI